MILNDLTPSEIDIQIAGTRIWDYFYDLALINGLKDTKDRIELRIQFGDAVVQLVRAIKYHINNE